MAQPLPQDDSYTLSGIDTAAARLEQAFRRLEGAAGHSRAGYDSLKAEHGKLNLLLQGAEEEISRMRDTVRAVSGRIERTIGLLEAVDA